MSGQHSHERDNNPDENNETAKINNIPNKAESSNGEQSKEGQNKTIRRDKKGKRHDHSNDSNSTNDSKSNHSYPEKKRRKKSIHSKERTSSRKSSRRHRHRHRHRHPSHHDRRSKKSKKRRYSSSSSSSSSSDTDSTRSSGSTKYEKTRVKKKKKIVNTRLLEKLAARGETLEEREERRSRIRSERIASQFGYTPEDNPFRDPNLHEPFSWKKKEQAMNQYNTKHNAAHTSTHTTTKVSRGDLQNKTISEIEKVRQRRREREQQMEEMERIRAEESRMREQENYDDWVKKEEEFHLRQQRQRSAIRLVEGREKPIDVLAKNVLLFGMDHHRDANTSDGTTTNTTREAKYREKYNALEEVEALEAELEEPHIFLRDLKLEELEELQGEVRVFCFLEREANAIAEGEENNNPVLKFWEALQLVIADEMKRIQTGGEKGSYAIISKDICNMFEHKSMAALDQMKEEIQTKISKATSAQVMEGDGGLMVDIDYWQSVLHHLGVFRAKSDLSDMHSKMLVRQLEKLEKRKDALSEAAAANANANANTAANGQTTNNDLQNIQNQNGHATEVTAITGLDGNGGKSLPSGDLEEELGLNSEVLLGNSYIWQEKYRPRKPRYFNRVKTGYDWNKYNQTHYDHDNPPPKIVQGYKFNVFYPDLIDKRKTPQYFLERCADSDDFCILRFHAGPPYEDVAFKIINREWNKSRKRGFRCTFERGVLSLYFNFNSHWYRR